MIGISELRIGNWVTAPAFVEPFKVDLLTFHQADFIEPIPLTPEILEKCGFVHTVGNNYETINFRVWLESTGTYIFFERKIRLRLDYLHQLQNLYYALTNTELKINL